MIEKAPIAEQKTPEKNGAPADVDVFSLPRTTGEKAYEGLQFVFGKALIMIATGAIAYVARYGKPKYGSVPNYFKNFQEWFHNKLLHNKIYPMAGKGEFTERLAGAVANTMLLFHGGNLFAPLMKNLENNRQGIAGYVNRHFGEPGEEAISDEKFKETPQQNWGDIVKGRIGAWLTVFTGFVAVDALIGKDKKTGMFHFDKYEEWFGRWTAGFSKAGKEIAKVPLTKALTPVQSANSTYRLGKILALDFYATSAAIIIWNMLSRGSAHHRHIKKKQADELVEHFKHPEHDAQEHEKTTKKYTDDIKPCAPCMLTHTKHHSLAEKLLANRKDTAEAQTLAV